MNRYIETHLSEYDGDEQEQVPIFRSFLTAVREAINDHCVETLNHYVPNSQLNL